MNTLDAYKQSPMSSYSPLSQPTVKYNNISDVSLESIQDRLAPRQMASGVARGAQTWFNPGDGSKVVVGVLPDTEGEFGIAFYSADGELITKYVGPTRFIYDPETGLNTYQDGKLPNDRYGYAAANDGFNVEDGFE